MPRYYSNYAVGLIDCSVVLALGEAEGTQMIYGLGMR